MATYLLGDVHGCFAEMQAVLKQANFNPKQDTLFLTGDLVARGPQSLECLRYIKSLGQAAKMVLGNHDLHLIATALGIKNVKPKDRLDELFMASDFQVLIDWLRYQPIFLETEDFLLVHAGISPDWDLATTRQCAHEIQQILTQGDFPSLLAQMYDNTPNYWQEDLQGIERLRYSINVFTRMRFCELNHHLDFACKLSPKDAPRSLVPWFDLNNPLFSQKNIVFGHWASLLDTPTPITIYPLDTGCVWGNKLTLLRWEDKKYFTQTCLMTHQ